MNLFKKTYSGKKVLITGNTGFKGAWLTTWLLNLGAEVHGASIDIPTNPSMFSFLNLDNKINHNYIDIRNFDEVYKLIDTINPNFIFHLAAQAIVSTSYYDPTNTISTNVIGTMNILEVLRIKNIKCCAILITSDKCYDNVESIWGYKETDAIGGKDIYSGSKGATENIIKSYYNSYFKNSNVKIGIARAGNVIGGGDWAKDRIVVDCMKSWSLNIPVELRRPNATRPWQHVLEPLSGYLTLGAHLYSNNSFNGEAFNFGPDASQSHTVLNLINSLSKTWNFEKNFTSYIINEESSFYEAGLLKLNCDKALYYLKWIPTLQHQQLLDFTGSWYYQFYKNKIDMYDFSINQINEYVNFAKEKKIQWTL